MLLIMIGGFLNNFIGRGVFMKIFQIYNFKDEIFISIRVSKTKVPLFIIHKKNIKEDLLKVKTFFKKILSYKIAF